MAAAVVYYGDPSLPKDPRAAYLKVLHLAGVSATANDAVLVSAAGTACTDYATGVPTARSSPPSRARGLTTYQAYLALILAAQYQCPSHIPEATDLMVDALNQLPATS